MRHKAKVSANEIGQDTPGSWQRGKISHRMTKDLLLPAFNNPILAELNDGAIFELGGLRLAFSTDSYTIDPIFSPAETSASWRFTGR